MGVPEIIALAWDAISTEREFNRQAGVSEEFFPMPEFIRDEPLPPFNAVFDVPMKDMLAMWDGFDPASMTSL
jgi:aldehyde:ferredoxin oxidoreductase